MGGRRVRGLMRKVGWEHCTGRGGNWTRLNGGGIQGRVQKERQYWKVWDLQKK